MTRETKIGLLVGLAFIIVIGVLLSDHIQSATQPPRAQLVVAPDSLQKGIVAPGGQAINAGPMTAPSKIEPVAILPTNESMNQPAQAEIVKVGPGNGVLGGSSMNGSQNNVLLEGQTASESSRPLQLSSNENGGIKIGPSGSSMSTTEPTPLLVADIKPIVTGNQNRQNTPTIPSINPAGTTTTPAGKTYVAVEGDSLHKITVKHYGKFTKAGADLILGANPQMGPKGEKVAIGKPYIIPPFPGTTGAPSVTPGTASLVDAPVAVKPAPAKPEKPTIAFKTYTVKQGDSLWKIADKQLGGGHTFAELKALNKDLLKGTDIVKPGMVLKIPTGQLASAD